MPDKDVSFSSPADANWHAFERAWSNGHRDYVDEAERFNDYYLGHQWDEEARSQLENEGRPALTLNEILRVINAVHGHYSQTRADIQYKPRRAGATPELAGVLTRLTDYIFESNDYHSHVEPRVFLDGLVEDRGYFDIRMDFSENVLGEVKITPRNPREVIPDQEATSADPREWREVLVTRWMSLDDIEAYYGKEKRKKVEATASSPRGTYGSQSVRYGTFGNDEGIYEQPETQHNVRAIRVLERQYRKMTRTKEFVHLASGATRIVPDNWSDQQVERVAAEHGLAVRDRVRSRVRWTVTADRVVLHDDWSPYADFTIVPFFPIYRRGRPSGLVRHLIDPQEQLNKIESQVLHTINTTANSGWLIEDGSLVNMTEEELEQRGAESGLVLVYSKHRQPPQKITANTPPTGLERFVEKSSGYIQNIPGAGALMGQTPDTNVSGVALDRAQNRAILGLQMIFDNLDFTRKLVAQRVLDCVQTYYTEHRVFYVTNWRDPEEPEEEVEVNAPAQEAGPPQQMMQPGRGASMDLVSEEGDGEQALEQRAAEQAEEADFERSGAQPAEPDRMTQSTTGRGTETPPPQFAAARKVANNITVGVYDVVAGSTATRDTWEEYQFAQALELRKAGVAVPDHHIILNSQLAGKDQIAQEVKQLQGLGEPTEAQRQAQQLELAKAQAEVAKLEAEVQELRSRAEHNAARAQTEVAEEEREQVALLTQRQLELARIRADLKKAADDLENKVNVAQIHSGMKDALTRYQEQVKSIEQERDRDSRMQQEQLRAQTNLTQEQMRAQKDMMQEGLRTRAQMDQKAMETATDLVGEVAGQGNNEPDRQETLRDLRSGVRGTNRREE